MAIDPHHPGPQHQVDLVELLPSQDRAKELAKAARAPSTKAAWKRAAQSWMSFLQEVEGISPDVGMSYHCVRWIAHQEARGLRPRSIAQMVASLGAFCVATSQYNPTDNVAVRNALQNLRIQHGVARRKMRPITTDEVRQLVAHCPDNPLGIRDRALILVLYATGMRRSNLVALDYDDVTWLDGSAVALRMKRSKTDQEGHGSIKVMALGQHQDTCPVRNLRKWCDLLEQRDCTWSALFHSMNKGHRCNGRMSVTAVNLVVSKACQRAGIDPNRLGTHSFRRGHAHTAFANGATLDDVADQLGHEALDTTRGYLDERNALTKTTSDKLGL